MIIPVILAGGSGTRLWPLSRQLYPKQFLNLSGGNTLFQETVLRLKNMGLPEPPIVVCNEEHRFIVAEQLQLINVSANTILLEPAVRNTAPALAVSAIKAVKDGNDPVLLALPSDHFIGDLKSFKQAIQEGAEFAAQNHLVTFGVVPVAPETGYGYIRKGQPLTSKANMPAVWQIDRFVEKPDLALAEEYLASGKYLWNSGIFMFKASKLIEEMQTFAPAIMDACKAAVEKGRNDLDFYRLDIESFAACPGDSIDYAIMEKTSCGVIIALESDWNDLGSWEALWQVGEKDVNNNVLYGDISLQDVTNSFVHASSRLVTAIGLDNHVIVETKDAVFISPRDRVQQIKAVVENLSKDNRSEVITHKTVYRPWGSYTNVEESDCFQVKRITVKPKAKLSLQKHYHRAEHWVVVKGTALVTKGEERFILKEDQSTYISIGTVHRLENPGKIPLELIEIQSGRYLQEDDIERMDDIYGRTEKNKGRTPL
ncbi:mannose-1-phosphate guanylyltransferase/mannose-6-phosphate isomerase [Desulfobacterium sp. N47]|uniref:mannose-1-phosphate guanylyltransferase n=1 Tax=uncultured Desulfobacterium sp. TaxID=201089 RepID=E1YC62_9BACT|nr:Xanthan biosynthesis protein xanB [uncultured Desulfobacterium sp.]